MAAFDKGDAKSVAALWTENGEMSLDEAIEFFEYNVIGSYMGPETPIFVI